MALAVPTPTTRPAGTRLTGAIWQSDVTDPTTFLLNPPQFVLYASAVQSIPNNAWTSLAFGASANDPYVGHSNTVNNSRWTCPTGAGGWYTVCGVGTFVASSANFRAVRLTVNGNPVTAGSVWSQPSSAGEMGVATPTRDVLLAPGDYLETQAYQSTGAALNTNLGADLRCGMWGRWSHAA